MKNLNALVGSFVLVSLLTMGFAKAFMNAPLKPAAGVETMVKEESETEKEFPAIVELAKKEKTEEKQENPIHLGQEIAKALFGKYLK